MVKQRLVFLLFGLFSLTILNAQDVKKHTLSADVAAQGLLGYSNTYKWYGGTDLKGVLHYDNTDVYVNFEALTKNVYSLGLTVSPAFEVCKNGYVFADGTLHTRLFGKYKIFELIYAGSVGFRMDFFSVQVGIFSRTMDNIDRDWHSLENHVTEPFNLLYKVRFNIMGAKHPWDIYLIGSNYTDFEYERIWEPLFTMGWRHNFKDRWKAVAEGTLKAAGMFHGTAKFYGAMLRFGVVYKLK